METKTKARLEKKIGKDLLGGWKWTGSEFFNFGFYGVVGSSAHVKFIAGFQTLKVEIDLSEYNLPDEQETFAGMTALQDSISWTAERLVNLYEIISKRAAPYVAGYINYQRAVKGEVI